LLGFYIERTAKCCEGFGVSKALLYYMRGEDYLVAVGELQDGGVATSVEGRT